MTKTLFSLNGLATELDRDRRTVAAALSAVKPDGMIGQHKGGFLTTALRAMELHVDSSPKRTDYRSIADRMLDDLEERVTDWQYYADEAAERLADPDEPFFAPLEKVASDLEMSAGQLLIHLRAGLPYAVRACYKTGAAFQVAYDWVLFFLQIVRLLQAIRPHRPASRFLAAEIR